MRKAIINKELMGDEQLYYNNGWYYCKHFTLRGDSCYIEDNCLIKKDLISKNNIVPLNCYLQYDYSTIRLPQGNKDYVVLECDNFKDNDLKKYKIQNKYFKNILSKIYNYIIFQDTEVTYTYYTESVNGNLTFYNKNNMIGWLEPCVFEIYSENDEENDKVCYYNDDNLPLKYAVLSVFEGVEL